MKKFLAAALAATLVTFSAQAAVTVTSSTVQSASAGGLSASLTGSGTLFNFDNGVIVGSVDGYTLSNNNTILSLTNVAGVNGSDTLFNTYSAPTGDTTNYLKIGGGGTETIASNSSSFNTLSLFWGSPDDFNTITFLDQTGASIGSISAASIAGLDTLAQSALVTMNLSQSVYGVTFGSTSNAFELDNVKFSTTTSTAAVPEPAGWAMMIVGFGAVGYAMRRRQSRTAHRVLG